MLIFLLICVFLSFGLVVWMMFPDPSRRIVRKRIYTEVKGKKPVTPLARLANFLAPINKPLASGWYFASASRMIEASGLRISPLQTLVVQEMGAGLGAAVYFFMLKPGEFNIVMLVIYAVIGAMAPSVWLNNKIRIRRFTFSRDLPEMIDLMTLCVVAGSDFMGALERIVREYRPCPIRDELGITLQEVKLGKRRRDALRSFAKRLQIPEASTFARTLIQVDRMGTGLADAMYILSEDMRLERHNWADRYAQQAPLKLLLPLILSLAAAMTVVAAPILVKFMRGGLMSGSSIGAGPQ